MRYADGYDLLCFLARTEVEGGEEVKCACQKLLDMENGNQATEKQPSERKGE